MTGYKAYRSNQVTGAGPLGLVLLTYDSLVTSLTRARAAAGNGDIAEEARFYARAFEAIVELTTSLNMAAGGEVSRNLASLYSYMSRRLLEGQMQDSLAATTEVLQLATTLREGWKELEARQANSPRAAVAGG